MAKGVAVSNRAVGALLCLAVAACLLLAPATAQAEVRKADVIAGTTVEERGLTVAECPSIDASYAILVSQDGSVYFSRESESPSRIASITKVMTAMVAIDNAPEGTFVAVSQSAAEVGGSTADLQEGDVMDFQSALKALMVPSGNDAAVALAETVGTAMIVADPSLGNDPTAAFVNAMNEKAAQLGCADTVYENPHGLDDGVFEGSLHSTAADQALVAREAMTYPLIRDIVSAGSTSIVIDRAGAKTEIALETTDELLEMYEYAIGIKTGSTDSAGPSFMGAASKDERELYAVVLGSADEYQRFVDAEELFEWAYDHLVSLNLANSEEWASTRSNGSQGDVPVVAAISHGDWVDRTVRATLADPDAAIEVFDFEGNVSQSMSFDELHGTVNAGDKVGTVVFKQRNQVVAEQNLVACETVSGPNPIDVLAVWWQRLTTGATSAETEIYNVMPIINYNQASVV